MAKIGLIRCEKNEDRCPLTGCFRCLETATQGFSVHGEAEIAGVFTCRCPGDQAVEFAKILKSKGADAIHFCTCAFSAKAEGKWVLGNGFCEDLDRVMWNVSEATGLPCVKGTAHLPEGYQTEIVNAGQ
jgi:predicted metal-binding protein